MQEYPDPNELSKWLVRALRVRGRLVGGLRLRVDKLPDGELPWRPLEGAKGWNVDRLLRYRLDFAIRPGNDPEATRQRLEELPMNIQEVLDHDDILGGRYPAGYADREAPVTESEDGRFLTSTLNVSLVAPV